MEIKKCTRCNGTGKINERMIKEFHCDPWIPTKSEDVMVRKYDKCPDCNGNGELQLKWIANEK